MDQHAYVYIGEDVSVLPEEVVTPTADVEHVITERLAIADARQLKEAAYRRPQFAPKRHIVVVARDIPIETQNALLKVLEEPPQDTVFHIVVPRRDGLLSTVLSRVQVVVAGVAGNQKQGDEFNAFVQAAYKDRLAQIEGAHKKKDSAWFAALFSGAEVYAEQLIATDQPLAKRLLFACMASRGPGASQKMLAEDIALTLPNIG